jgi:hypothetical protein
VSGQNRAKYAQSAVLSVNGVAKIGGARCAGNPMVPPRPRLATIEQAAVYLGLGTPEKPSVRSVWRLIEHGDLTPVRLPGLRRTWVQWAQIDALVDGAIEDAQP